MKTLFYSTKDFERKFLEAACHDRHNALYIEEPLTLQSAGKAEGFDAVCIFPGDDASAPVIEELSKKGVRFIAIRASGYDNVDIEKAMKLNIAVANVPAYSPYSVAEHAVALALSLNRKLPGSARQLARHDFTVSKLIGFDMQGKTVGIIGTGRIGSVFARIMHGFGCRLLAYDIKENPELVRKYRVEYTDLTVLCRESRIISLHTCLTPATRHLINKKLLGLMQHDTMLINTSRGGCVDTKAVIDALESGQLGYFGTDVYEFEKGIFFYDHSERELKDELLVRLLAMPNVLVTPHQAFATQEALRNIAHTTVHNLNCWENKKLSGNEVRPILETSWFDR